MDQMTDLHQTYQLSEMAEFVYLSLFGGEVYTEMFEKLQIFTLLTTSQEHRWRSQVPSPAKGKR